MGQGGRGAEGLAAQSVASCSTSAPGTNLASFRVYYLGLSWGPIFNTDTCLRELPLTQFLHTHKSYLPVRAGWVIRTAHQLSSLLALHTACGAG